MIGRPRRVSSSTAVRRNGWLNVSMPGARPRRSPQSQALSVRLTRCSGPKPGSPHTRATRSSCANGWGASFRSREIFNAAEEASQELDQFGLRCEGTVFCGMGTCINWFNQTMLLQKLAERTSSPWSVYERVPLKLLPCCDIPPDGRVARSPQACKITTDSLNRRLVAQNLR